MKRQDLSDEQYGFLFDVRRSMRYHDRRCGFFDQMHRVTNFLTILMAGSVLYSIGGLGNGSWWFTLVAASAAMLASMDMVVGYARRAGQHKELRNRFARLEIEILNSNQENDWLQFEVERLKIEQDEPPVYRALDLLCRNEMLVAEGIDDPNEFSGVSSLERLTCHFFHWPNIGEVERSRKTCH